MKVPSRFYEGPVRVAWRSSEGCTKVLSRRPLMTSWRRRWESTERRLWDVLKRRHPDQKCQTSCRRQFVCWEWTIEELSAKTWYLWCRSFEGRSSEGLLMTSFNDVLTTSLGVYRQTSVGRLLKTDVNQTSAGRHFVCWVIKCANDCWSRIYIIL